MKIIPLVISILLLSACSVEPGSEKWCEQKKEQSKSEWTAGDAKTYTTKCLIDGMAIGSEEWCKKLSERPKGEWTADETGSYAKHCVL
jgi:hypothetical protein